MSHTGLDNLENAPFLSNYQNPDASLQISMDDDPAALPLDMGFLDDECRDLTFQGLCYKVPGKNRDILHDVSGHVPAGQLCGVLGPSGAGKSSLFDVLLGQEDGTVYKGSLPRLSPESIAYVTQEITLVTSETCFECLKFYADLSLPTFMSEKTKIELVEDTLAGMDLNHCAHLAVGGKSLQTGAQVDGVSRGERRRVFVGCSLVRKPQGLILDEPTTGLDATNSLQVVKVLSQYCKSRDIPTIVSLHQPRPEILMSMDLVLLLARGRVIFWGDVDDMLPYLTSQHVEVDPNENPADFALDYISGLSPETADVVGGKFTATEPFKKYDNLKEKCTNVLKNMSFNLRTQQIVQSCEEIGVVGACTVPLASAQRPPLHFRVYVLLKRLLRMQGRDKSAAAIHFRSVFFSFTSVTFSLFVLEVEDDKESKVQEFCAMMAVMVLLMMRNAFLTATYALVPARALTYAEGKQKLYDVTDMFITVSFVELFGHALCAPMTYTVVFLIVGWDITNVEQWFRTCVLMAVTQMAGSHIFFFMTSFFKDFATSFSMLMNVFMASCVMGGFFVTEPSIPHLIAWMCRINPQFWSFAGVMLLVFRDRKIECDVSGSGCHQGNDIIEMYGFQNFHMLACQGNLLLLAAIFWVLALWAFRRDYLKTLEKSKGGIEEEDDGMDDGQMLNALALDKYGSTGDFLALSHQNVNTTPTDIASRQYVDVNFEPKAGEKVLDNVSLELKSNTMTALMGPSGAGKTLMLKVIASRPIKGDITAAKFDYTSADNISYIAQDEVLMATEKVEEVLQFACAMLTPHKTQEQRGEVVVKVMKQLKISHIAQTIIGGNVGAGVTVRGCSGGEQRRVSIACAMLKDPSLLVCDEPTSGLDAHIGLEVMQCLKELNQHNTTVVCTIHQPRLSTFKLFDQVALMAHGQMIWRGVPAEMVPVFERLGGYTAGADENPADFVLDCLTPLTLDECKLLKEKFSPPPVAEVPAGAKLYHSAEHMDHSNEGPEATSTSFVFRFKRIFVRHLRTTVRNKLALRMKLVLTILYAFILTLPYLGLVRDVADADDIMTRVGSFLNLSLGVFVMTASSVLVFQATANVLATELSNGYFTSLEAYLAIMTVEMILVSIPIYTIFTLLVYGMMGLRVGFDYYFVGVVVTVIIALCAQAAAAAIGILMEDTAAGLGMFIIVSIAVGAPSCGMLTRIHTIPWYFRWLCYINPIFYHFMTMVLNEYEGRTLRKSASSFSFFSHGDDVVNWFYANEFTGDRFLNIALLTLETLVVMVCGWRALQRKVSTA